MRAATEMDMPCGAELGDAQSYGIFSEDFYALWVRHQAGLSEKFGYFAGVPRTSEGCAEKMRSLWIRIARNSEQLLDDPGVKAAVEEVNSIRGVSGEFRKTRALAAALDTAATAVKFENGLGDALKESARDAAASLGDSTAWAIESLLAPIVGAGAGALGSAVLPYGVLAAAGYVAYRRGTR